MMMMFLYLADCFSLHLFQFQFISQNFNFSQISHKVTKAVSLLLSLLMNSYYILQKMALWPLKFWLRCWTSLGFLGLDERHDCGGIWKVLEDAGGIWMILDHSGGNLDDFRGFLHLYLLLEPARFLGLFQQCESKNKLLLVYCDIWVGWMICGNPLESFRFIQKNSRFIQKTLDSSGNL